MGSYPVALFASPETRSLHPDFTTPDRTIPVPFFINEKNCIFRQIFERYLQPRAACPPKANGLMAVAGAARFWP